MTERKQRRQMRLYMCYNLIAFTIIFGLFAGIIYLQIQQSLFLRIDDDLYEARDAIREKAGFVDQQLSFREEEHSQDGPKDAPPPEVPELTEPPKSGGGRYQVFIPMRVQVIIRDEGGEVLNGRFLGRIYWDDLLDTIPFSADRLNEISNFRTDDGSHYRALSFATEDLEGDGHYVQLLSSADGEQGIINSFFKILVVCSIFFILLSITASYILSKKNIAPVLLAWRRQTEFVENASHELRTPLTIIQNKLESLLLTPGATVLEKADSIAVSLSETRRLSKLTSDLMTLARADSGEPLLNRERFPVDDLIENLAGPYVELAGLQGKKLLLRPGHGGAIEADKGRVHELLVILLDNALKYTREGDEIVVSTALREGRTYIRVADTGIGIQAESADRIFDRFYREDKARSREQGGTGLGLSIAKWIVDTHGGSIRAGQNKPRGTCFEVRIPK